MKVKELIEILKKADPEMLVEIGMNMEYQGEIVSAGVYEREESEWREAQPAVLVLSDMECPGADKVIF